MLGDKGGRALRRFKTDDGVKYIPGAELTSEMVDTWPLKNRKALESSGFVKWYDGPKKKTKKGGGKGRVSKE